MSENSIEARVSVLENQMDVALLDLKEIKADTNEIKSTLSKQKGFIAGVLAVITPIWALIVYYVKQLFENVFN